MTDKKKDIWPVIVRYLDGTLSNEETEYFEEWLDNSNENRRILHSVDQIWKASKNISQDALLKELNLEKDWELIAEKIDSETSGERKDRIKQFSKIRKRQQLFSNFVKVAALILVAFTSGFLTLKYAPVNQEVVYEPVFKEITTKPGERANVDLGDGSQVVLNAGSKLVVPDQFSQSRRVVELTGQAFFDVESDMDRPFFIKAGNSLIKVVGTAFDVRSYAGEKEIQVVVSEGTVEFSREEDESGPLILNEGYVGKMSVSDGSLRMEEAEDMDLYLGWMNGRLIFREKPLKDVITDISRWYDVQIELDLEDQSILENRFTADLKTRSIRDVMEVLAMSMEIDFEIEDETVRITNK
ncbi:MAG: FecR domain-containing protein [Balneolaceae bacterium]